jgi:hypothetical protein
MAVVSSIPIVVDGESYVVSVAPATPLTPASVADVEFAPTGQRLNKMLFRLQEISA